MSETVRQNVLSPVLPAQGQKRITWSRLYGSAKSLAIANAAVQSNKPIIIVTEDSLKAANLINELKCYLNEADSIPVLTFPDWETLPYDRFSPYQDIISERLETLFNLPTLQQGILVVPITTR